MWYEAISVSLEFFSIAALPSRLKDKKQKNNLVATIPHITNIDLFQDSQVKFFVQISRFWTELNFTQIC